MMRQSGRPHPNNDWTYEVGVTIKGVMEIRIKVIMLILIAHLPLL